MNKLTRVLISVGLFILIVAAGVGIAVVLVKTKENPKKAKQKEKAPAVQVHVANQQSQRVNVTANGIVISAQEIVLQPEVTGRVVWKSPKLVPGGTIHKGEPLLRLDPRDYVSAVEQQRAQLESRKLAFDQEQGRRVIAKREWDLFGDAGARDADDPDEAGRALALREPHIRSAKASLQAAQAGLDQSRLALSRTLLAAPFNAFVQSENVDIGQLVSPAFQLAHLVGTDSFWIQVSVPVDRLPWIRIPGLNAEEGSVVKISQQVGNGHVEREGKVIRLYGDLDPAGRMARVLVEVPQPMRLDPPEKPKKTRSEGSDHPTDPLAVRLPLLLGAYVRVSIDAGQLENVFEIPRIALREDDKVYVVDKENKLCVKKPVIVWRRTNSVLVRGLDRGAKVITSPLATPLEGMVLRIGADTPPDQSAADHEKGAP